MPPRWHTVCALASGAAGCVDEAMGALPGRVLGGVRGGLGWRIAVSDLSVFFFVAPVALVYALVCLVTLGGRP